VLSFRSVKVKVDEEAEGDRRRYFPKIVAGSHVMVCTGPLSISLPLPLLPLLLGDSCHPHTHPEKVSQLERDQEEEEEEAEEAEEAEAEEAEAEADEEEAEEEERIQNGGSVNEEVEDDFEIRDGAGTEGFMTTKRRKMAHKDGL